jgi:hypothetical protein
VASRDTAVRRIEAFDAAGRREVTLDAGLPPAA